MVGPATLAELLGALRSRDVCAAATRLAGGLAPGLVTGPDRVIGLVWATVDLERTAAGVEAPFLPADRDRLLGGRPLRLRYGGLEVLVEEPDTEGRLAAFLSRHGEGIAGWYIRSDRRARSRPPADTGEPMAAGPRGRRPGPAPTPLGEVGSLRPHELPWGPFVIVVGEG